MKQATIILFFIAFFCHAFSNLFIWAAYLNNEKTYAANCINKSKPMMHCNGKCQVQKKIQQEQKEEQQSPELKTDLTFSVLSSKSFFAELPALHFVLLKKTTCFTQQEKLTDYPASVFHPPSFCI